jgi:crossover junction endodeoxyribonuclease RusA
MKQVILVLPYPISANRYWATRTVIPKGGRAMAITYVTPEAKAFKAEVVKLARAAGVVTPIPGRVRLDIRLYPHRPLDWQKRQRLHGDAWSDTVQCIDLGNAEKVLSDALKDVVMEDDKWIRKIDSERMEPDHLGARVVVRVMAIEIVKPQAELEIS